VLFVYGSLLWIPLVLTGYDPHGFVYLYIATVISMTTQNPLAVKGEQARAEAEKADLQALENYKKIDAALEAIITNTRALHAIIEALRVELRKAE
jgi:oligoribonuclease (3'-5' exoribonuclease)